MNGKEVVPYPLSGVWRSRLFSLFIMSFGFSPSDILVAVRLAAEIYDKCFTRAQGAGEFVQA